MKKIFVIALLVFAVSFGSCSTKPQLVGTWAKGKVEWDTGETWQFRPDKTFLMRGLTSSRQGKYTVLDNGSIKIEFQGGSTATGKLENGNLIINPGKEQIVLRQYQ